MNPDDPKYVRTLNRDYQKLWDQRGVRIDISKSYVRHEKTDETLRGDYQDTILKGIINRTPLSDLFFHKKNIQTVQNMIRFGVFKKTNFKIAEQNTTHIMVIMRGIYLQYAKHLNYDFTKQIKDLNVYTVEAILPNLISNTKQYLQYLVDVSTPYRIMERPINVSNAGTKSVRLDTALGF